jgi:NAD(P)-dependent dehydrogenase (short-subunit alcohol dehydrogenase family)
MSRSAREPYDVRGKTAFITGAARGIGAGCAERLHARGANVALVGLEPELLEQNAARLGERASFVEADVTDSGALEGAVAATVERFGGIDVAIANAGIAFTGAIHSGSPEHVERTLAVNLLGVWRTDRAVIGEIRRNRGYLLNIASLAAVFHGPLMAPYTCAKAGVEAFTDALRMESAPAGAAVGCAYFGFIDTDLVRASFAQASAQGLNERMPGFMRNPIPLSRAVDAIERGIERRSARLWAPRWVGATLLLRGLIQPLSERRALGRLEELSEAIRLTETSGEADAQDPVLGVAACALGDSGDSAASAPDYASTSGTPPSSPSASIR